MKKWSDKNEKHREAIQEAQRALTDADYAINRAEAALYDLDDSEIEAGKSDSVERLESLIRAIGLNPDMTYTGGDLSAIREAVEWVNPIGYKPMAKSAYKELLIEAQA